MVVPSSFRLEHVVAQLIERLDGTRLSFADRDAAMAGMRRVAEEHVDAVAAELRASPFLAGQAQVAFLRREVLESFLPRFVDAAMVINAAERNGYGLGRLADPLGRVLLVALALLVVWRVELRFESIPAMWPVTLLTLAVPFLPDILGRMEIARYERSLRAILADMERIQASAQLVETEAPPPASRVAPPRQREPQ